CATRHVQSQISCPISWVAITKIRPGFGGGSELANQLSSPISDHVRTLVDLAKNDRLSRRMWWENTSGEVAGTQVHTGELRDIEPWENATPKNNITVKVVNAHVCELWTH